MTSLRARITLTFGGLTLAVSAALALAAGQFIAERIEDDNGEALSNLARGAAGVLGHGLGARMKDIELLASAPATVQWATQRSEVQASLARLQRGAGGFAWVGLADPEGRVQLATHGMLVGQDVRDRTWFGAALKGPFVGDVHRAQLLASLLPPSADGGPARVVDFAAPVRDAQGALIAVLGAHGHWDWVGEVIEPLRSKLVQERGVEVLLLDHAGRVIHRPRGATITAVAPAADAAAIPATAGSEATATTRAAPTPTAAGLPATFHAHAGPPEAPLALDLPLRRATVRTWPDGQRYLTAQSALPDAPLTQALGWTVVVRQPQDSALAAIGEAQRGVALLGVPAALVVMALSWVLAGRLSRPLRQLTAAAQAIEGGALHTRIPTFAVETEIGGLSQALKSMTDKLLSSQDALKEANGTLEARVLERTEALAQANRELDKLARRDALTGLFNRRVADERLDTDLARHRRSGRPLCLLMVDVDHFKRINDRCGHERGDAALKAVAHCLLQQCRTTDVVARFGGEEFLVLLPDTAGALGLKVAEKLRAAIAALDLPGVGPVTVSIGVAEMAAFTPATHPTVAPPSPSPAQAPLHPPNAPPRPAPNPPPAPAAAPSEASDRTRLLHQADLALYAAKRAGRNRALVHDASMG